MFSGDPILDELIRAMLGFGGLVGILVMALSWGARMGGTRHDRGDGWDGR